MAASSDLVVLQFIPETAYGVTPSAGDFVAPSFDSETLTGDVGVAESELLRSDRLSAGQVVTNVEVRGGIETELQDSDYMKALLEATMLNSFVEFNEQTLNMTLSITNGTLTRTAGSFIADGVKEGDFIKLSGYTAAKNNVVYLVSEVEALVLKILPPTRFVEPTLNPGDEAGSAATKYKVLDKLTIGKAKKSFSIEKSFSDLVNKALIYRGMVPNTFGLTVNHGEIIKSSVEFMGSTFQDVAAAANKITNGRTLGSIPTAMIFNASVDGDLKAAKPDAAWSTSLLKIKNISFTLNNNYQPINVLGRQSAIDYVPGSAMIEFNMDVFVDDVMWPFLSKKLTQDPIQVAFKMTNRNATYGFYFPACQVTQQDPQSGGKNQTVEVNMQGVAKVGAGGESSLIVFRDSV